MDKFIKEIKKLKKYGVDNKIPNVSNTLGMFLNILIKNKNIQNVLEIGTANGVSTLWMAEALKQTRGNIITFEFSIPSRNEALENFKKFKLNKYITSIYGDAIEKIKELKLNGKIFDLIFIDGQKNNTLNFFITCKNLLKDDGIIIIDDVIKYKYKMMDFYKYIKNNKEFFYLVLPIDIDDGIMLIIKKHRPI